METAKNMKSAMRPDLLEIDPDENALVVHYEADGKAHEKKIKVKSLSEHSNVPLLAQEIISKCKMIPPTKVKQVEKLLYELQRRNSSSSSSSSSSGQVKEKVYKKSDGKGGSNESDSSNANDPESLYAMNTAKLVELDTYVDQLYDEENEVKVKGLSSIYQLSCQGASLEKLVHNESLMGLLSRVCNEEYKKSYDLVRLMMSIFRNFTNFSQFHAALSTYRIGAITMKVVEFEIKRHHLRLQEEKDLIDKKQTDSDEESNHDKQATKSNGRDYDKKDEVGDMEDRQRRKESKESNRKKAQKEIDKLKRRTKESMKKQDKLLYICFGILLNLAEDLRTEHKMVKKSIIHYLIEMLDRVSTKLVIVTVTFLKKLSVVEENKDIMAEAHIVERLVKYIPCSSEILVKAALKLIYNLSFASDLREVMVKNSMIPKLIELLKRPAFRALTLRILYHLSADDRCKSMFTYTEAIPIVMQLVMNFPQNMVARELIALAINLSHHGRNAELMCQSGGEGLKRLMDRFLRTRDPLLMKVIRNLSQWTHGLQEELRMSTLNTSFITSGNGMKSRSIVYKQRGWWSAYVVSLIQVAQDLDNNHDLLVDVLGTLANLTPLDLPEDETWASLLQEHALIPFLHKLLVPGFSQDDMILEVVIFVGTLLLDPACASLLTGSRILRIFHGLLQEQSDDEITLQILFTLHRMLFHSATLNEILYGCGVLPDVLEVAASENVEIRKMCDAFLDVVLDHDTKDGEEVGDFGRLIRERRFEIHNAEYVDMLLRDRKQGHSQSSRSNHYGNAKTNTKNKNDSDSDNKVVEDRNDSLHESHSSMETDDGQGDELAWSMHGHRGEHISMDMDRLDAKYS